MSVSQRTPLEELLAYFDNGRGGRAKLCEILDVGSMTISQWKKRGVPAVRAKQIEELIGGKFTRRFMLPDLFGRAKRATPIRRRRA